MISARSRLLPGPPGARFPSLDPQTSARVSEVVWISLFFPFFPFLRRFSGSQDRSSSLPATCSRPTARKAALCPQTQPNPTPPRLFCEGRGKRAPGRAGTSKETWREFPGGDLEAGIVPAPRGRCQPTKRSPPSDFSSRPSPGTAGASSGCGPGARGGGGGSFPADPIPLFPSAALDLRAGGSRSRFRRSMPECDIFPSVPIVP